MNSAASDPGARPGLSRPKGRGDGDSAGRNALTYVLITPARNEAALIEQAIRSVVRQTVRPAKWVIVSDGSEDGTDGIVAAYARSYPWIELTRVSGRDERHFGGKARAFNAGVERVRGLSYDIIGNLDADITFEEDYIEFLLGKFAEDPRLGVAGTPFRQGDSQYDYRFSRTEHVSGACQLFRRACFESVGGYISRRDGGIDLIAVVTARMKGWKTETFLDKVCLHHRTMGKAGPPRRKYIFRSGSGDYLLGVHPLWQVLRSFYQMSRKPVFISGFLLLTGYFWAMIRRAPKPVSKEFVRFRRGEQIRWLKESFRRAVGSIFRPSAPKHRQESHARSTDRD